MENTKPRLFVLGDSFAQWPKPEKEFRWPVLMEEHYDVYNLAIPGTDNSHITYQLGQLPKFKDGDRLVIVLSESSRIPKWYWGSLYDIFLEYRHKHQKPKDLTRKKEDVQYVEGLTHLRMLMIDLLENTDFEDDKYEKFRQRSIDHPFMLYEFISNLPTLFEHYKPVIVTWDKNTYNLLPEHVKLIGWNEYEHIDVEADHHPSKSGNKVWYEKIYNWLQQDPLVIPPKSIPNEFQKSPQKNNT